MNNVNSRSNSIYTFLFLFCFLWLLFCVEAIADSTVDQEETENLLNLLSQQTTLATNSRLNADFVPGMISIMTGEEMQIQGFRNLWDAMAFMPGVQKAIDSSGMPTLTVRGINQSSGSGKIKLLLNNVTLNSSSSSTTGTLLNTPVNQIERVEFIRGPGSAIHGEFSFSGVINVITLKKGEQYSASLGSSQSSSVHLLKEFEPGSLFHGSINLSASGTDGESLDSGTDRTPSGNSGYAPGKINNKEDSLSAILDLNFSDINILFQYQQSNRGDHYGINNYLPPPHKQTVISDTLASLRIQQPFELSGRVSGYWSINQSTNSTVKNAQFLGAAEIYGGSSGDSDIVSDIDIEEQRTEAKLNLSYQLEHHKLLTEFSYIDLSVKQYQQFVNLNPNTLLPSTTFNEFPSPVNRGQGRNTLSIVLQDEYEIDESQTITTGIRYDDYNDIGDHISPRIAFVWRLSQSNILKLQYAEAFRPPILLELEGAIDGSIDPETIKTIELSFIHDRNDFLIKNTIYSSKIEDLIAFQNVSPFGYGNFDDARISGYEIEVFKSFIDLELSANLSLQETDKKSDVVKLYELAPWLLSVNLNYKIKPGTSVNLLVNNIPETGRVSGDSRANLSSSTQVDLTLMHHSFLGHPGLSIAASARNITSEEVYFAAQDDTYINDYLYSDSPTLWVVLTYRPN